MPETVLMQLSAFFHFLNNLIFQRLPNQKVDFLNFLHDNIIKYIKTGKKLIKEIGGLCIRYFALKLSNLI